MKELELAVKEEEKAKEVMEKADQTMRYWKGMYQKYRNKVRWRFRVEIDLNKLTGLD